MLGQQLRVPYQALVDRVHTALVAAGHGELRPAHLGVFQHIDHPPGGTRATDLAERMQISKQSVGELVAYLEEHRYVERIADPTDGRARLVRLTARGWRVHETAAEVVAGLQREWGRRLGKAKLAQLRRLLDDLAAALGA